MPRFILIGINVFFFTFLTWPLMVRGLDPKTPVDKYIHHIWTTRDGLPQNTIHSIVQDSSGCLWLGTDRGVVRFDGSKFKVLHKGNIPAIKNNSITSLLISQKRTLWMGTYGGGITRYKEGKFKNYSLEDGLTNHFINTIAEDHQQNPWFGTTGDGVIQLKNNTFTSITHDQGLSYNIVSCLFTDRKGNLWVGTEKGLNSISNNQITVYTMSDGLPGDNIKTIFEDSKGCLWVGTNNGVGFIRNRPKNLEKGKFFTLTRQDGLTDNFICSIIEDKNRNIWIATNGGLNRINANSRTTRIPDKRNLRLDRFTSGDGLSDDALSCLYEDRWGNLWIGTSGGGLNVLRDGKFEFYTEKDGLTSGYIKAIYEDAEHTLWIGTGGSGLNRFKQGKFTAYTKKNGLSSNDIESLCSDNAGNLWIGTTNGLNRFKNETFQIFTTNQGLSNQSIKSLYADSKGNLWVGTFGGGLNRYQHGEFEWFDTEKGLSDNFVLALEEDKYGNLWVGTNRGLNCFDRRFFRHFSGQEDMPRGRVLDIYCDPQGVLWIATNDEGLIRYKNGIFTSFKSIGGFADQVIYRVLEDHQQNLWLSSNKGIFAVSRRRLNWYVDSKGSFIDWRHFQEGDGLKTSVCSGGFQPAGWKTSNHMIWFPTIKGIAVMDLRKPKFIVKNQPGLPNLPDESGLDDEKLEHIPQLTVVRELPVRIENVVADNVSYNPVSYFKLPAGTEKIEFYFTAVNYGPPGNVVFKYRLMGCDKKWIRSTNRKSVVYLDVPAGDYEFKVLARLSDGNWSYEGDSCFFAVKPSFHQTFWFYFLLTLGLTLVVFGIPKFLEVMAKKRKIKEGKYKSSTLTVQKSKTHLNQLLKIMVEEKPYLDPELSLQKLAKRMEITKEDLSQVINEQLKKNFKNFVNEYRIEEAKKKLLDPRENQFVIMKIALDVGFNSKSVFNASFKKFTGISPSEYRKKHQNK
ncbi:MAG: helix-turn-helix domain-containing protein [Candidatus Aminicenantes bacterium]|nr:MAG: helix-turn-helix domain-containing protein [Candidatus Aminicenantes bacterium]